MASILLPPAPLSIDEIPASRLRALLRDFTILLGQQMYFWGRDVVHPRGNLLCESGFERRRSEGLDGTSCYRRPSGEHAVIELHGACAGFYSSEASSGPSFLYIRNRQRCFLYSDDAPPAPGLYSAETLRFGPAKDLYFASLKFLDWWLEYEEWIAGEVGTAWRERCHNAFASLPASRASLPPAELVLWLSQYRNNPGKINRIRERLRSLRG